MDLGETCCAIFKTQDVRVMRIVVAVVQLLFKTLACRSVVSPLSLEEGRIATRQTLSSSVSNLYVSKSTIVHMEIYSYVSRTPNFVLFRRTKIYPHFPRQKG